MKTKKILFYLIAAALVGCVPSLHRLYTDKDLIFDPKLLGVWSDEQSKWTFEKGKDEMSYKLTVIFEEKKDKKAEFDTHMVKFDNMLFLDLFPTDPEVEMNVFLALHLVPAHTFIKVEQIEPTL